MKDPIKDLHDQIKETVDAVDGFITYKVQYGPEVLKLAQEVIKQQAARANEDIDEWAKNLVDSMYKSPGSLDGDN